VKAMYAALALAAAAAPVATTAKLADWTIEAESAQAHVVERHGVIDIDTPKGLTLWWRKPLVVPVVIAFDAMLVGRGGVNDTVSDLNAFWMARDVGGGSVLTHPRSGAFAAYDDLETYYVGIGGNRNTTTRFRRYIGRPGDRPLRTEDDRRGAADMLRPNVWTHVRLIADGKTVAVDRDGMRLFTLADDHPYTSGQFGLRTTWSHLRVRHVRITQGR
jgi:hypothetical protein